MWLIVLFTLIAATSCMWVSEEEISGITGSGGERPIIVFGKSRTLTEGEVFLPPGITVDNDNNVYVCSSDHKITKFDGSDNITNTGDKRIDSINRFRGRWQTGCEGLEADSNGNIYVATGGPYVYVYNSKGELIKEWGSPGSDNGQLRGIRDIAVNDTLAPCDLCSNGKCPTNYSCPNDKSGVVYVSDTLNFRVSVFDTDGNFLFKWGSQGTGDGQFSGPRGALGIAVDENTGYVYVADTEAHRIQKFDKNGGFIKKWGQEGNKPGDIKFPRDVEVDRNGYVYVADTDTERIQIFDPDGNFIMEFQGPQNEVDGPFHPRSVAVNHSTGEIFVAAAYANRIDKFKPFNRAEITSKFTWDEISDKPGHRARRDPNDPNTEGQGSENYLCSWGWLEKGNGLLRFPQAIAIGADSYIYIADTQNTLIQKFDTNGNFIKHWGCSGRIWTPYDGGIDGHPCFDFPINIATDEDGNVYQLQTGSDYGGDPLMKRVQKFDPDGNLLENWQYGYRYDFPAGMFGIVYNPYNGRLYISNTPRNKIQYFDKSHNFLGEFEFTQPMRIAADRRDGSIYVVDFNNYQIHKFDQNGNFILKWGKKGSGDGEFWFDNNSGIFVDKNGYVYVADTYNNRIQVFDSNGNFVLKWGKYGDKDGEFYTPMGIVVDSKGYIYVLDTGKQNIQKFNPIKP